LNYRQTVIIYGPFGRSVYYYDEINTVHKTYNIDAIMRGCDSCMDGNAEDSVSTFFEIKKNDQFKRESERIFVIL